MEVKERTEQHCETEAPNGGAEQRESDGDGDDNEADILQHAIDYCMTGRYPPGLTKDKKRAVRELKLSVLQTARCIFNDERTRYG